MAKCAAQSVPALGCAVREGAPEMEKFCGIIHRLYFDEKRTTDFEERQKTLSLAVRAGKKDELRNLLATAQKKAQHPLSNQMIMLIARRFDK